MKIGRLFPDLLATLERAASSEAGFTRTLRLLVTLAGARAGGLRFRPGDGTPLDVIVGARRGSALEGWIQARLEQSGRGVKVEKLAEAPPGIRSRDITVLTAGLGDAVRPVGGLVLLGPGGPRGLAGETIPPSFPREFGHAMEQVWRLHQRTLRLEVINEVIALTATTLPLDHVYGKTAEAVARLIRFDALSVTLFDRERGRLPVPRRDRPAGRPEVRRLPARRPPGHAAAWVARASGRRDASTMLLRSVRPAGEPRDAVAAGLPLRDPGSAVLAGRRDRHAQRRPPRAARLHGRRRGDLMEVARPLASAVGAHARLHAESVRGPRSSPL